MDKTTAIKLLGGTAKLAAQEIGITPQAVGQWPASLPPTIADRVQAAIARKRLPPEALGLPKVVKVKAKA
jgi:DNA-binding transcriptional regulator YdaS (Cro superfamily)